MGLYCKFSIPGFFTDHFEIPGRQGVLRAKVKIHGFPGFPEGV
jgi:hypothetical protein